MLLFAITFGGLLMMGHQVRGESAISLKMHYPLWTKLI